MKQIDLIKVEKAIDFYQIDLKYRNKLFKCAKNINENQLFSKRFWNIYNDLFIDNSEKYREYQSFKNLSIDEFFEPNIDKYVTNLMLILGFEFHDQNMKKNKFSDDEIIKHKMAIKELYYEDMEIKKRSSIRISLMLWGVYYIKCDLRFLGRLLFQKYKVENAKCFVKIHIPREGKSNYEDVINSINTSKIILKNYYGNYEFEYLCNSWLLSNQIYEIIDKDSNIAKFRNLFEIKDRENCLEDLLFFVFNRGKINDFNVLQEDTSIQRKIKEELKNGKVFYLGEGKLKNF